MKEALFWKPGEDGSVQCLIDPKYCTIKPGQKGFCRVRENIEGKLYSLNYGKCTSYGLDPIEKKPLYHFYPGSNIFSLGSEGCNFRCQFCQNWQIAQEEASGTEIFPEKAVALGGASGYELGISEDTASIGLAYTYSEPSVWYEYILDTAKLARKHGLKNVLVTNGFINQEPLENLLPYIDAMNIDVKGFTDSFYNKVIFGELAPVRQTVELAVEHCHVEITTLVIPGLNDSDEEIDRLAHWLASVDPEIPLHLTRFFPNYQMNDLEPTPLETLERARETALKKLAYVYIGNAWGSSASHTYCPTCQALIVKRDGYGARIMGLRGHHCIQCGREIKIVGLE